MKKFLVKPIFILIILAISLVSCQEEDLPKANFNTSLVTSIDAAPSHEKVVLSWIKPAQDLPVAYRVSWTPRGETADLAATETSYEISGLEINKDYIFAVQAIYKESVSGKRNIEVTIPDEINFKAFAGSKFVQLQWNSPNREDLVGYELITSADSQTFQLDKNTTSYVVANLENGTEYSFTLTPKYQNGLGNLIEQAATPGFVEMIFASKDLVNSGESIDFSYNPAFLLNQEIAAYSWDFNDGTTDATQDPTHAFSTPGKYEVSLVITDSNGTVYSSTKQIDIIGINWEFATSSHIKGVTALYGEDGTIYIGDSAGTFYALNPNGTEKWNLSLTTSSGSQEIYDGSPALGQDGTIYVTSQNGNLYAISQAGAIKWVFTTIGAADIRTGPAIADDGTIYINDSEGHFYAVNSNGTQKWSFAHAGGGDSNPAIASDGTVYFGSDDDNLYALNPDGTVKWNYTTGGNVDSSPSIGDDGTVYFGAADNMFYAVTSEGELNWSYNFDGQRTAGTAVIGIDGTVFTGVRDNKLYAFNAGGGLKWSTTFSKRFIFASATLDANGNLYIGNDDGNLYALNQESGEIIWEVQAGRIFSSPTIGEDGNIYIGTLIDSNVAPTARFLSIYGSANRLADSPWPTKRGNKHQTGKNP
jgi:outer membrane protein assembly factor BamB